MTFDNLRQDLRLAIRGLLRAPGFAAVTILTLALGIGANTAIFSIVNGVILRPLPYPNPEQLMYLTTQFPAMGFDRFWVSPPEYFEFRELNQSFAVVGAYTTGEVNLTAGDRPLRARSASVDDALLTALGIQPLAGRLFAIGEADLVPPPNPSGPVPLPPICLLSYELWQSAFGGQRNIVGQMIEINGLRREVIGIMPPGADVMDNRTEIWMPIGLNPGNRQIRGSHFLYLIGRLKDGVTETQAKNELTTLIQNWGERTGVKNHVFAPPPPPGDAAQANPGAGHILQMHPVREQIVGSAGRAIWMLQAAVGFVLLIACANLANLMLARAETRHREFAVRTALGAGRGRLLRQFMTEGVLLSILGGVLGLVLARAGVQALIRLYPSSLPRTSEVTVDPAVLLFTLAVSIVTGLVFGLAPLMHTRMKGLANALKEGGAKGATAARHHIRRGLVMAEVALAVMLVIGAGLLIRTVYNLAMVDAGFDRSRLVTFQLSLAAADYPQPPARAQFFQRLQDRLRATPGIQGASAMSGLPPNRPLNANDTDIGNYTAPPEGPFENVDYYQNVMTNYFETMGIPIVKGRPFQLADAASGPVVIVNETLVNTFWKDRDPIGQTLKPGLAPFAQVPDFTVIGVAKDVKQGGVDQKTGTELYLLIDQAANAKPPLNFVPTTLHVVLRTTLPPASLRTTLEASVREGDASVPIVRLRDMESVFNQSIERPRLLAQLLGGFAGLALLLAVIGTYGVLSYMVAERRREIGIRMALGADQGNVLAQVLKQGLMLTTVGVVAGLAGAFAMNRLIASMLYGVQPTDPATLIVVVATITLVAALACWLPAWRASRVDPIVVLRED
ncbi:MAG TPA: ABC transporter permease [Vicinamibacterales bacterium]|nr:ABC transporter permease [Vicinamibacterales bacterium]